ncbi:MAG: hypothetical protein ACD_11C00013G0005 [uncultured bacterium]|nr:MAG: hypothetical protein ACD_11C00013G0005 [uncultured bacterium]HBR71675.1 hypothetical protein [Candidatus Moranbacteria bacterium]
MKKNIVIAATVAWIVATTGYVIYDIWSEYKIKGIQKAYNQGVEDMTTRVINEVGKRGCEAVEIYVGEKKIQIANAQCLPAKETVNTETKK